MGNRGREGRSYLDGRNACRLFTAADSVRPPVIPFRCIEITNVATGKKPVPPRTERKGTELDKIRNVIGEWLQLQTELEGGAAQFPTLTTRIYLCGYIIPPATQPRCTVGLLFPSASGRAPSGPPSYPHPSFFLLSKRRGGGLSRGPLWPLSPHFRHPLRRALLFHLARVISLRHAFLDARR